MRLHNVIGCSDILRRISSLENKSSGEFLFEHIKDIDRALIV